MISQKRAESITSQFKHKKILVYGDIIFDRYIFGDVERISPEAPVPVVKVRQEDFRIGGAGNVASNIDSLGGQGILLGVVGDDIYAAELEKLKRENYLPLRSKGNQTLIKTRILAKRQQIVRVDREEGIVINSEEEGKIIRQIGELELDGIVVSDYAKGSLNRNIMEFLKSHAKNRHIPLIVDPKPPNFDLYRGVTCITPNRKEAEEILGKPLSGDKAHLSAVRSIQKRFQTKYSIITRGEDGITAAEKGKKAFTIPVYSHEVFDVTGAGDTVASVLVLALVSGASLKEALVLANAAASIAIEKIGTAQVSGHEILARLKGMKNRVTTDIN